MGCINEEYDEKEVQGYGLEVGSKFMLGFGQGAQGYATCAMVKGHSAMA